MRTRLAPAVVVLLALAASARAQLPLHDDAAPVIPVREREVWFRDQWNARLYGGRATDSTLGEITTRGQVRMETDHPGMIGLDVGRPLVDDFRDLPLDFAWRVGTQRYFERGAQDDFFAHAAYLKMYWRPFPWEDRVGTRIGFGEGLSYTWSIPSPERDWQRRHGGGTSRLLNYLDVSLDLNVGDLLHQERARRCSLGIVIAHRSGAFGLVDIFGNVHSGSNYNTAALECAL